MIAAKKPGPSTRTKALVVLLAVAAATYLLLLPRLRQMQAETARLDRQTAQQSAMLNAPAPTSVDTAVRMAESAPNDAAAQLKAAQALSDAKRYEEAEARAREALSTQPGNAEAEFLLGDIRHRQKDYFGAIQAYRSILQSDSGNARASVALGSLYIALGWTQDALEVLQAAAGKYPTNLPLKVALAMASAQRDDLAKAESLLREVKAAAPNQPALWGPLLPLLIQEHHYEDAVTIGREIASQTPGDPGILSQLGSALLEAGHVDEAAEEFQKAISANPQSGTAHAGLARCLARQGRKDQAIAECETVLRIQPQLGAAKLQLGQLYLQSGRKEEGSRLVAEAEAQAEKAKRATRVGYQLSNKTGDADAHWQMAQVYRDTGDTPRETVELRRALELNPNHKQAQEALGAISQGRTPASP